MSTNITEAHKRAFDLLTTHGSNALVSCFVNGQPACAICSVA